jgi:hypothetical protein
MVIHVWRIKLLNRESVAKVAEWHSWMSRECARYRNKDNSSVTYQHDDDATASCQPDTPHRCQPAAA